MDCRADAFLVFTLHPQSFFWTEHSRTQPSSSLSERLSLIFATNHSRSLLPP